MTYIDLNPVRAGLVAQARDYPWSSHGHYTGQRIVPLINPHALFWELGNTPFAREATYAQLVQSGISPVQQAALTDSALSGWALGEPDFVADLQKRTARRVAKGAPGRPVSARKIESNKAAAAVPPK
jgi:putative transposase